MATGMDMQKETTTWRHRDSIACKAGIGEARARSPRGRFLTTTPLTPNPFQLPVASGHPWCPLVYRHINPVSVSSPQGPPLCVSVPHISLSCVVLRMLAIRFRAHSTSEMFDLESLNSSARPYLSKGHIHKYQTSEIIYISFWRDTILPTTRHSPSSGELRLNDESFNKSVRDLLYTQ